MFNLRDNLQLLYDFYIVSKEKSYSKAAEKNYISQSNLSRSVKKLEETTKLKLINRSNKGIELTQNGLEIYNALDKFFNNETINFSQNELIKGSINIGTTRNIADFKLNKYISKFNKKYPNIEINIWIDSAHNLKKLLNEHKINILIDYLPYHNDLKNMKIIKIDEFKTCFVSNKKLKLSLQELKNHNLTIPGPSRRKTELEKLLQKNNIELNPKITMPDSKLMADFIKTNDFIGYMTKEEASYYNLNIVDFKEDLPTNEIGIIYFETGANYSVQKFIKFIGSELNENN